jgi:hypothetical protein
MQTTAVEWLATKIPLRGRAPRMRGRTHLAQPFVTADTVDDYNQSDSHFVRSKAHPDYCGMCAKVLSDLNAIQSKG